ncbi:MAG TPA: tetraacyldisaccharide 4'-kinase, partial [Gemmatimonadota bacterium]|nr:tetraacyldisaccharide 4'-kinase [Gemmatimonadota bacterium]
AARAVATVFRPDLFLLDDGLQHRRVARALDLVAFTAADLVAPARCLPAGPLRQGPDWRPPAAAWVVAGCDPRLVEWAPGSIGAAFTGWWRELPGSEADWVDGGTVELAAWARGEERPYDPGGAPVVAFAGVARPESVERFAARAGHPVSRTVAFPDHHRYRPADVALLRAEAPEAAFVTTEKDAVKLPPEWFGDRPVGVLRRRLAPRAPEVLAGLVREAMAWPR